MPSSTAARNASPRRGLALGCGGTLGFAWSVGALVAVRDLCGWEARDADALIGTSAGAELTVLLGSGATVDELTSLVHGAGPADLGPYVAAAPGAFPPLPRLGIGSLRLAARRGLPALSRVSGLAPVGRGEPAFLRHLAAARGSTDGWLPHDSAWLVAMDYRSGTRTAFGSPAARSASLVDALCASWAVPGWFPPVEIEGRRYVDGGASSTASVDLLLPLDLDEVLVIAPMASLTPVRPRGLRRLENAALRQPMTVGLIHEISELERAGTRVTALTASDRDLAVMGPNFMDARRRVASFEAGLRTIRQALQATSVPLAGKDRI